MTFFRRFDRVERRDRLILVHYVLATAEDVRGPDVVRHEIGAVLRGIESAVFEREDVSGTRVVVRLRVEGNGQAVTGGRAHRSAIAPEGWYTDGPFVPDRVRAIAITPADRTTLAVFHRMTHERGFTPTIREMATALGVASTYAVVERLTRAQRKGLTEMVPDAVEGQSRPWRITALGRRILAEPETAAAVAAFPHRKRSLGTAVSPHVLPPAPVLAPPSPPCPGLSTADVYDLRALRPGQLLMVGADGERRLGAPRVRCEDALHRHTFLASRTTSPIARVDGRPCSPGCRAGGR